MNRPSKMFMKGVISNNEYGIFIGGCCAYLNKIRRLVGDITAQQLTYVDCSVTDNIGIFMPVAS